MPVSYYNVVLDGSVIQRDHDDPGGHRPRYSEIIADDPRLARNGVANRSTIFVFSNAGSTTYNPVAEMLLTFVMCMFPKLDDWRSHSGLPDEDSVPQMMGVPGNPPGRSRDGVHHKPYLRYKVPFYRI